MSEKEPKEPSPREALLQIVNGYMISHAIYVLAKLDIPDALADGPMSSEELAGTVDADPRSLHRVLRSVAGVGVLSQDDDGRFALTPMGKLLRSDVESSVKGWTIMRGEPVLWRPWGEILHSVKTGKPAFDHVFSKPAFDSLRDHPDDARLFDEAMRSISGSSSAP